jgi:catecholate siderophore receptor
MPEVRSTGSPWLVASALAALAAFGGKTAPALAFEEDPAAALDRILALRRVDVAHGVLDRASLAAFQKLDSVPAVAPGESRDDATVPAEPVDFDIPPGLLQDVLTKFQDQSGWKVSVANASIPDIQSPGVRGRHTPEEALRVLLEGTSVAFTLTAPGQVTVDLRLSEFVEVTARESSGPASPKYTEPLRDIPQTITIVPRAVMEQQNATTLRDVLRNVTGISVQAGEGGVPAGDNLTIRGFSARTDIFIDGVRDFGGYSRDPFNVEQVEVTKGPSSAFGGRGSTGGAVNLSTKTPGLVASQEATVGFGNGSFKRATLDLNIPFEDFSVEGTALRVNAMWNDADVPGRDVTENQRWGFAPSLALGLGTSTRLLLSYSHLDQDNLPDYGIPWVPPDNQPLADYADHAPPVDFANFYGLTARDYEDTVTDVGTVDFIHAFRSSLSLRSVVRYGQTDRDSVITAPRFASDTSTDILRSGFRSRDQLDGITANQNYLTSYFQTGGLEHSLVTGLELVRETSENYPRVESGPVPPPTDLFEPNADDPYNGSIVRDGALAESTATSVAVYAFDTIDLSSKWQVTGGLRWEEFDLDYSSRAASGVVTPFESVDAMTSWRAGLVYKPRSNGSVYLGAGTSFNPSSEGLTLSPTTVDVDPEKSRGIEAGAKWDLLSRRLSLSTAVFSTVKTNARTPGLNPGDPPMVLEGEHRVDGVELSAVGNLSPSFRIFGGYTFMTSEITESNNPAELGNEFGNTPRHSLSLWTTRSFEPGIEVGGGLRYVGDRYNNNTETRVAPGYWLVDAMASYGVNEMLTLRLNLQNLGNVSYIDRVGGGHFIPGDGRSIALTADLRF